LHPSLSQRAFLIHSSIEIQRAATDNPTMRKKNTTPFQAAFWLSSEEMTYLMILCAIFLIGLALRYFYLKTEQAEVYRPDHLSQTEPSTEN
jgi:hypothetical protein